MAYVLRPVDQALNRQARRVLQAEQKRLDRAHSATLTSLRPHEAIAAACYRLRTQGIAVEIFEVD